MRIVRALDPYRVQVTWITGEKAEIDLAPHLLRYAIYRPLRDQPASFRAIQVVEGGVAVAWPEHDLDVSADTLKALLRAQVMDAGEFRDRLKRWGMSFEAAAATFEISRRQIAYYAAGAKPVPRNVVLALRGFEAEIG